MYEVACCVCNEQTTVRRKGQFPSCNKLECRIEARKRQQKAYIQKKKQQDRYPSESRLKRIAAFKANIGTKEKFAEALASYGSQKNLCNRYKLSMEDIIEIRKELCGDMSLNDIRELGQSILEAKAEKVTKKVFERKSIPVKVYFIKDLEAYREGLKQGKHVDDDNLRFDHVEYASEIKIPFNRLVCEELNGW
jgi:hypothetical protein